MLTNYQNCYERGVDDLRVIFCAESKLLILLLSKSLMCDPPPPPPVKITPGDEV
jgi:hypothetical protein